MEKEEREKELKQLKFARDLSSYLLTQLKPDLLITVGYNKESDSCTINLLYRTTKFTYKLDEISSKLLNDEITIKSVGSDVLSAYIEYLYSLIFVL